MNLIIKVIAIFALTAIHVITLPFKLKRMWDILIGYFIRMYAQLLQVLLILQCVPVYPISEERFDFVLMCLVGFL